MLCVAADARLLRSLQMQKPPGPLASPPPLIRLFAVTQYEAR